MTLTYRQKLKIFHDTFIEYAYDYIKRQKAMELGQEIPAIITLFRDNLTTFRITPVVREGIDVALAVSDLWNGRLYSSTSISINSLFPFSDRIIKQMLSEAIQEATNGQIVVSFVPRPPHFDPDHNPFGDSGRGESNNYIPHHDNSDDSTFILLAWQSNTTTL